MSGAHAHAGGDVILLGLKWARRTRRAWVLVPGMYVYTYVHVGRTFSSAALQRLLWYG